MVVLAPKTGRAEEEEKNLEEKLVVGGQVLLWNAERMLLLLEKKEPLREKAEEGVEAKVRLGRAERRSFAALATETMRAAGLGTSMIVCVPVCVERSMKMEREGLRADQIVGARWGSIY